MSEIKPEKLTKFVEPFIGVDKNGSCLCGPYLPQSMMRLCPDTVDTETPNGYNSNKAIKYFSHTHVSGTGGGGRYGNIGIMPFTGIPRLDIGCSHKEEEAAEVGYYTVKLIPSNIKVELTSSYRSGYHRYTFPENSNANIVIDVGAVIQVPWGIPGESTGVSIGGFVQFISATEVVGRGDFRGGWGHSFPYSVYFYSKFEIPAKERLVANSLGFVKGLCADGPNCKALINFGKEEVIEIKVGISFVSIGKARASVENEIRNNSFEEVKIKSLEIWESKLSKIKVTGGTYKQKQLFYTLFTKFVCMPTDLGIDDENPLWVSGVRSYTDFYCLWDSARNANSLLALIDPELQVSLMNCLLDIADHTGWLPDAWISGNSAQIQGGSSSDILFCEAALKGLKGIDYEKALVQMRKNNEIESPDPLFYGRYLKDYEVLGFVSTRVETSCVSRHLEYAYQDYCIGRLAEYLGQKEISEKNYKKSQRIWNLWREDIKCFAPKNSDGTWVLDFDPNFYANPLERWKDPYFYEGYGLQWSFNLHQDFEGLIDHHGGSESFVRHLDDFFEKGHYESKETMLHIPYLYIYAGRPDKTADRVNYCLEKYFDNSREGLADNEDAGCQSAFYICSAIGLYPIMGQDIYLLTTPIFSHVEIELGTIGSKLIIEASQAENKKYIVSATLNGENLDRAWVRHSEICRGGILKFELGYSPGKWGTLDVPKSPFKEIKF